MPLEKQVTSRELSQRLKELGVKQKSLFYYMDIQTDRPYLSFRHSEGQPNNTVGCQYNSAFTVAELGEMLPEHTLAQKGDMNNGEPANWYVSLKTPQSQGLHTEGGVTEADARAKMMVFLLENKLVGI